MDRTLLMNVLDDGNHFNQNAVLQLLVLCALRRSLSEKIVEINQEHQENSMREIKSLATDMKGMLSSLKKLTLDARSGLESEISRASINAAKIRSITQELKEANLEVEAFLGEAGSNFEDSEVAQSTSENQTDKNGVTLNKDQPQ